MCKGCPARTVNHVLQSTKNKMTIARKIISGDDLRPSRLHDEKGNLINLRALFCNFPLAASSGILRLSLGYRPRIPWISYTSLRMIKSFLNKKSRVLEFGSGMSTIWYSKYAGQVYSVEDNYQWYEKNEQIIASEGINNIDYRYLENEDEYSNFMSHDKTGFDLIMIDGSHRSKCVASSLNLLRPDGIFYLDNSDNHSGPEGGDTRIAEKLIRRFAIENDFQVFEITDFAPTQFFVQQGLWFKSDG